MRNTRLRKREGGFWCRCELCQFEIENTSIVDPAAKVVENMAKKSQGVKWSDSREAIQELEATRCFLFKQFNLPVPKYEPSKIPTFDMKSPQQFSLARLLLPVLRILLSSLRKQHEYEASIPYITEIHALIGGNLKFAGDEPRRAPNFAMTIWSHHRRQSHSKAATLWLEELKKIYSFVGGKSFYKDKFLSLVDVEIASHPLQ